MAWLLELEDAGQASALLFWGPEQLVLIHKPRQQWLKPKSHAQTRVHKLVPSN